jgi:multiple sugar transport system ATP-binding protein
MTHVKIKNLKKSYNGRLVLKNLSLEIPSGSIVALLGPTGAGKTTLLKCIAGVEQPDDGEIYFDNVNVTYTPPWDRNVALFFQTYALYPHMSVYDNIAFPLRQAGVNVDEIDKMVKFVATKLRITHLLDRKEPSTLSGGEMQRVALARTLVRKPRLFLLDEPISNLDAKLREEARTEFKRIHREFKQTIIYATPDFVEAFAVAEKIAVMKDGEIIQYDEPINLIRKPVNRFVATFVGSPPINIVEGNLVRTNDKIIFKSDAFEIPLHKGKQFETLPDKAEMAFRAQSVLINPVQPDHAISGKVLASEFLGHETILTLLVGNSKIKAVVKGRSKFTIGDQVSFSIDTNGILFIDPRDGKVILV